MAVNKKKEEVRHLNKATSVDLDSYFKRISYFGIRTASHNSLREIHFLHPQAFPFENLNPLLRIPVNLDIQSLQQKLILGGRGGYCLEQNLLLQFVLIKLGFKVKGLAARVLWNVPEGVIKARDHMLLLVEVEDKTFIVDVGFGGLTLTAPLLLKSNIIQETPHEKYRLIKNHAGFVLEVMISKNWKPLYSFDLQEQVFPDYEVTNWYYSNHPNSIFIKNLIAARVIPDRRYALRNCNFAVHHLNGNTERHFIINVSELRLILQETFELNLKEIPGIESTLQQVVDFYSGHPNNL